MPSAYPLHDDSLVARAICVSWFHGAILLGWACRPSNGQLVRPATKAAVTSVHQPGRVGRMAPAAAALVTQDSRGAVFLNMGSFRLQRCAPSQDRFPRVVLVIIAHQFDSQGCSLGVLEQWIPCCWPIKETAVV